MNQPARVLVVDDQELNLRVMQAMLGPLGYQVTMARHGLECLEQVHRTPPDLILMDVMMPMLDGLETTRRLKQDATTRHIPIVMVTALTEVEDRVRALEAGADDFLSKPVEKSELRARVRSLLQVKAYHDHMLNYQRELEDEVSKRTRDLQVAFSRLQGAYMDTIMRLSRAAEYKDEDTGTHIARMSHVCAALARKLGLNENTVEHLLYASPMHDVGKIGIPDSILLKPGPLNPEEWEIMKQHTIIGARILSGAESGYLRLAEIIALTHHEKWDGSGYPRGLKGKAIPLAGRISALADVFDALTSARPYKPAFSLEKALGIIKEGDGKHFDPAVVRAFMEILDEVLTINSRFSDEHDVHIRTTLGGQH